MGTKQSKRPEGHERLHEELVQTALYVAELAIWAERAEDCMERALDHHKNNNMPLARVALEEANDLIQRMK